MTNKMPVVGQRYRNKKSNHLIDIGAIEIYPRRISILFQSEKVSLEEFWDMFEELPTTLQKTEEVQVNQEQLPEVGRFYRRLNSTGAWECENLELARSPNGPRFAIMKAFDGGFKERFNLRDGFWKHWELIPIAGEVIGQVNKTPNPFHLEKGKVNEVERALQNMKDEVRYLDFKSTSPSSIEKDAARLHGLIALARNLINALEAEKKLVDQNRASNPLDDQKEGNLTNKENETPKSIWKDVSELPSEDSQLIIRCSDRRIIWNFNYRVAYDPHNEKLPDKACKYCLADDFFNSFEQMQKDIEELKRRK